MQTHSDAFQAIVEHLPLGVMLLEHNQFILVNPAAAALLGSADQIQRIDGPDGLLIERIAETQAGSAFVYHVPATKDRAECVLRLQLMAIDADRLLVLLENITAGREDSEKRNA